MTSPLNALKAVHKPAHSLFSSKTAVIYLTAVLLLANTGPTHANSQQRLSSNVQKLLLQAQQVFVPFTDESQSNKQNIQALLINNKHKIDDWRLATTKGQWLHMAWSPNGNHLVAIEQQDYNLQPKPRAFYGRVPSLYTIHIFTLNLATRKLEEKQLLSQFKIV